MSETRERAQALNDRREEATFRLVNMAAQVANDALTDPLHDAGRTHYRDRLWAALEAWRKAHGLPEGWPIRETAFFTPTDRSEPS